MPRDASRPPRRPPPTPLLLGASAAAGSTVTRETVALVVACGVLTVANLARVARLQEQGQFAKYPYFADRVVAGDIPRERLADLSPGYLWAMAALRTVSVSPESVPALQIVMLGAAALCAAAVARYASGGVAAWAAASALLLSRGPLVNATEAEPETAILLVNTAALACAIRAKGERAAACAGLLFGASMTLRPAALLPAASVAAWLAVRARRDGRRASPLLLPFTAALLAPVAVVGVVNVHLAGSMLVMEPGTVFYEGMNPRATGLTCTVPQIVNMVELALAEPDALHPAYARVASRALGRELSRGEVNGYWTGKALAFARAHPVAAARLVLWKAFASIASYEAHDLGTMLRKERELSSVPHVPFGALVCLAVVALAQRSPALAPIALYALSTGVVLPLFYVSSRQRNALVPGIAVLAGIGISAMVVDWRGGRRTRALVALLLCGAGTAVLGIRWAPMREDAYGWETSEEAAASDAGRFDRAVAMIDGGGEAAAIDLLDELARAGYRPVRGSSTTSSLHYHRARAELRLGRLAEARADADAACRDAPGDASALALDLVLRAAAGDQEGVTRDGEELQSLHDPFTVATALGQALVDAGRPDDAERTFQAAPSGLMTADEQQHLRDTLARGAASRR